MRRAFSLIEVLVATGLVLLLVAIALPQLAGTRSAARKLDSLSRIRQIGIAVTQYADSAGGIPPVLFKPEYVHESTGLQTVVVDGEVWSNGAWFINPLKYQALIRPVLPPDILREPDNPERSVDMIAGEPSSRFTDYGLAACLYATPQYWDRLTQLGPSQWKPQRLADIAFPSQKGLAAQMMAWGVGQPGHAVPVGFQGVKSAVLWADLSASTQEQGLLIPGVPNFWHHSGEPRPRWAYGHTIHHTQDGILGRDR